MVTLGLILISCSFLIGVAGWWYGSEKNQCKYFLTLCFLAVLVGLALVMNEQIMGVSFGGATIKARAKEASVDAKKINE